MYGCILNSELEEHIMYKFKVMRQLGILLDRQTKTKIFNAKSEIQVDNICHTIMKKHFNV